MGTHRSEGALTSSSAPAGRAYLALVAAGFRRYATYRQAMVAASVTNTVFGFLRFAVMLASSTREPARWRGTTSHSWPPSCGQGRD